MQDLLTNISDNLAIKNGDFILGMSNNQHQKHIIQANKGEYKNHPEVGVGIAQIIADDHYTALLIETKKQLEYDGMKIQDVALTEKGKLIIDGIYKEK